MSEVAQRSVAFCSQAGQTSSPPEQVNQHPNTSKGGGGGVEEVTQ